MSNLDQVVTVNIDRDTQTVPKAAFGIPAIHSRFLSTKTVTPFVRDREYFTPAEMLADGWTTADIIYQSSSAIFAQPDRPEKIVIGRRDAVDADWTIALNAIKVENDNWYEFSIVGATSKLVFSDDFVIGDIIDLVVGGVDVPNTELTDSSATINQANVMALLKVAVEAATTGITVSTDAGDATTRTLLFTSTEQYPVVSGSVSPGVKVVFDVDFVTGNSIAFTVNGDAVTPVVFITDQATTMAALKTQLETSLTGSTATVDVGDVANRTIFLSTPITTVTASVVVTLGASQAVGTVTGGAPLISILFGVDDTEDKEAADWTATQKKLHFADTNDAGVLSSSVTTDIGSYFNTQNYDRSAANYHPAVSEYFSSSWAGLLLTKEVGKINWFGKTPTGLPSYSLTGTQRAAALTKKANVFTIIGGKGRTANGTVGSGEYIDIIKGLDELEARLQEANADLLFNNDIIPGNDDGITSIETVTTGVLNDFVASGFLKLGSVVVSVPKAADRSPTDKADRVLNDVTFTAILVGAINKINIQGSVSL